MRSDTQIGYYHSDFLSGRDKGTLEELSSIFNLVEKSANELNSCDMLLCFSDGDILRLPRLGKTIPPILPVELPGDNSFFAQVTLEGLEETLKEVLDNPIELDRRNLIEVISDDASHTALNDIYITSSKVNTRMRYDLIVDHQSVFDEVDSANGVLFSTPTGSTAMSMNLGGALIHPKANVIQFQAIASRNYFTRQQVFSNSSTLSLEIVEANLPLMLQVDNEKILTNSREFTIQKADWFINFVDISQNTPKKSLESRLLNKLSFEDTSDLTSSAKFILHVLEDQKRGMTVNEIMEITHIQNQKTLRSSLKLLINKGFVRRKDNLDDMREHLYFHIQYYY